MRFHLLLVVLLSIAATAQVTGDKSKKQYWPNECSEVRIVPLRDAVVFASAAEAESYGLTKGDTCTDPTRAAMIGITGSKATGEVVTRNSKKKWRLVVYTVMADLFPAAHDPKNVLDLTTQWQRFYRKRVKANGSISASSISDQDFTNPYTDAVEFSFSDGTDSIYLIMRKGQAAEKLRKYLVDERAIALVSFIALGETRYTNGIRDAMTMTGASATLSKRSFEIITTGPGQASRMSSGSIRSTLNINSSSGQP